MSRFLVRSRVWVALVLVVALVVPVGRWLVDELDFRASGDAVAEELGEDAALTEALLLVRSVGCDGRVSTGSAFALEVDGAATVVTNRHVVADARSVSVRPLAGGALEAVETYHTAVAADVAILELADTSTVPRALPRGPSTRVGAEVRVVGFPSGRPSLGSGQVAQVTEDRLVLEVAVSGGASGSPVLDDRGRVVGQVHATTGQGQGVATPVGRLVGSLSATDPQQPC